MGEGIGRIMGVLMNYDFKSKFSKILLKCDSIISIAVIVIAVFICFFDELVVIGLLLGLAGVVLFFLLFFIAWLYDKKKSNDK